MIPLETDDDHRPLVTFGEPPRHDPDHALAPTRSADDDGRAVRPSRFLDFGHRLFLHSLL